jgi:hypothetical protein
MSNVGDHCYGYVWVRKATVDVEALQIRKIVNLEDRFEFGSAMSTVTNTDRAAVL